MKQLFISILLLCFVSIVSAQDMKAFKLYHPEENAEKVLAEKVKEAKASGKHVFVQIGGNWCIWCARFHEFITADKSIDSLINANYVVFHLNFSKENENKALLAKLGFPQRFGFPVFIILDGKGERLHTQNSAYLEEGKGYNKGRVTEFFSHWTPTAIAPATYNKP